MFHGEYSHTIDTKGRLIIPAKFREGLGESFMITKGQEGCLCIYDEEGWDNFNEQISQLPNNKDGRLYERVFLGSAHKVELDKQGRILIPTKLREFAGLDKDVVLLGLRHKIEIWDHGRHAEETSSDNIEEISERMAELGLRL